MKQRDWDILHRLVDAYVTTGAPVSSGAIEARMGRSPVSTATIRAVMAHLENAGYLTRPHRSAGCIPTESGLRAYLDNLACRPARLSDRNRLREVAQSGDPDVLAEAVGECLSHLSGQAAVVSVPVFWGQSCREVGLVRCGPRCFLVYIVSEGGVTEHTTVRVDFDLTASECNRVQNYLNATLAGKTLAHARRTLDREMDQDRKHLQYWEKQALEIGRRMLPAGGKRCVSVGGATQFATSPDEAAWDAHRALLLALHDKSRVSAILAGLTAVDGACVMLASEHSVRGVAAVGSSWEHASGDRVTLSLMGPVPMDYRRWMPLMEYAASVVGDRLSAG